MEIMTLDITPCAAGEGPVWDVQEQALYFIDMAAKHVLRYDYQSKETKRWDAPLGPASLAVRERGGVIVALENTVNALDCNSGTWSLFTDMADMSPEIRFNDGKVDRRGRFCVGTSDRKWAEQSAERYRLEAGLYTLGAKRTYSAELNKVFCTTNGPCWSPDNRTFYISDSMRDLIYAYDYDIQTGKVRDQRLFATTGELGGVPDGATVDADGRMWVAMYSGGKLVCFKPNGSVERIIPMPVINPSSVSFGGPDLDELFVTSINPSAFGQPAEQDGGRVFKITGLGARGIPESRYIG